MARILKINRQRYVAGLTWRTFEDMPSRDGLRDMGDEIDARWCALRTGDGAIQAGFCPGVDGPDKPGGAWALAAAIADVKPQPWLGIFHVADGLWWYIAVRDGNAVLPDGDVIGTEEEIHAARERHSGFDDWDYLEGGPDELAALLEQARKLRRAAPLRRTDSPSVLPYAIAAVSLLAAGGALWWHHLPTRTPAMMALMRPAPKPAAPPVWLRTPPPSSLLSSCTTAVDAMPISVNGWTLSKANCRLRGQAASATYTWDRAPGASAAYRPRGQLAVDGNSVLMILPLHIDGTPGSSMALIQARVLGRFWSVMQVFGLRAHLSAAAPVKALPGTTPGVLSAPPALKVGITFPGAPARFGAVLDAVPGLRLDDVRYQRTGDHWSASGALHVRSIVQTTHSPTHSLMSPASPSIPGAPR